MFKKLFSFALLLAVAAPMYAQLKNDGLTPIEKLELVPQTEAQADAYQAGKDAIKELLVEKAAKGEKVSQEEVVAAVEQVYATVALRNNEKAIWFALGALSIFGCFLAWKYIILEAWKKLFGSAEKEKEHVHGPDCDHDHAPAPAGQPQTRGRRRR